MFDFMRRLSSEQLPGWHWTKHLFSVTIPAYPLIYFIVHGFRSGKLASWLYVETVEHEIPTEIVDMVESELEEDSDIKRAELKVRLTRGFDSHTYGGWFMREGAELYLPLRVVFQYSSTEDSESVLELNLRKKLRLSLATDIGKQMFNSMKLSEDAIRFLIKRELIRANSGHHFISPIFLWLTVSGVGFWLLSKLSKVTDPVTALVACAILTAITFYDLRLRLMAYNEKRLDIMSYKKSFDYTKGARDYFESSLTSNKLLRSLLDDRSRNLIKSNGDERKNPLSYTARIKLLEHFINESKQMQS